MTLKAEDSCCFTLFIYGGPCHLSIYLQTVFWGPFFPSENSLFIQLGKRLYHNVIDIVNITILTLNFLNLSGLCIWLLTQN